MHFIGVYFAGGRLTGGHLTGTYLLLQARISRRRASQLHPNRTSHSARLGVVWHGG
jgi:hypothetical protein